MANKKGTPEKPRNCPNQQTELWGPFENKIARNVKITQADYLERVEANRKAKDSFFATDPDSPIPHKERHRFRSLKYFPPDPKYLVKAKLHKSSNPELVMMTTSKGTEDKFHGVGYFEFGLNGKIIRLHAYTSAGRQDANLFIPFKDKTSGKESYGAARYLDLELDPGGEYTIDFNHAYNPYCAYSDDYICPLPPRENWLDVEIRAGEKRYHE